MNDLTAERAIEALYTVRAYYASLTAGYPKGKDRRGIGDVMCSEIANSCLMAIKALEQESIGWIVGKDNAQVAVRNMPIDKMLKICAIIGEEEQEPCDDYISRTELLSRIDAERKHLLDLKMDGAEHIIVHHARRIIEDLPSVTPQPKMGRWLEKEVNSDKAIEEWQSARCSVCDRYHTTPYSYYFDDYKFCPNCGARMEVEK